MYWWYWGANSIHTRTSVLWCTLLRCWSHGDCIFDQTDQACAISFRPPPPPPVVKQPFLTVQNQSRSHAWYLWNNLSTTLPLNTYNQQPEPHIYCILLCYWFDAALNALNVLNADRKCANCWPPLVRKWVSFTSSARSDGAAFEHWQKDDKESGDYAYARWAANTHYPYIAVSLPLRCRYIAVTFPLRFRYIAVT